MKIEHLEELKLKELVLISSLPDMGKVGGIVSEHLSKILKGKKFANIILTDKPWVNQENGLIKIPSDEYSFFVVKELSLVIFTGKNQPQDSLTVQELAKLVFETVKKIGDIKLVISCGGYSPTNQEVENTVYGIATNSEMKKLLDSNNVKPIGNEIKSITWFNGLILGNAQTDGTSGIGLFGKITDAESPQYLAAINVLKVLEKILKIKINLNDLEAKIIKKEPEQSKSSPGIG